MATRDDTKDQTKAADEADRTARTVTDEAARVGEQACGRGKRARTPDSRPGWVRGGLALRDQDRKHNPALRVRNLDHPSWAMIGEAPNGYHSVDQLERVPMGRLKAAHLPSDVVRAALSLAPEVKVEPLHAPGLPVGSDRPDDARGGSGWQSEPGGKPARDNLRHVWTPLWEQEKSSGAFRRVV